MEMSNLFDESQIWNIFCITIRHNSDRIKVIRALRTEDIRDGVLEGTEGVLSVLGELRGGISDGGTMGSSAQAGLESAGCLLQRLSNSAHQLQCVIKNLN